MTCTEYRRHRQRFGKYHVTPTRFWYYECFSNRETSNDRKRLRKTALFRMLKRMGEHD